MKPYFEKVHGHIETRYAACVSWPRSGHHLLVRLCQMYFGPAFGYCEFYGNDIPCCRSFPCQKRNLISISKNHDHSLDLSFDNSCPLIVQYRNLAPSIVSNFELAVLGGASDDAETFIKFANNEKLKYEKFISKWLAVPADWEVLVVKYEELTKNPEKELVKAIKFLAPQHDSQLSRALLHKSGSERTSPFPGQTYPTGSVTGMPRAV